MDTAWYYLFSLRADMAGVVHGRSTKETPHPGQTIIIGRVARLQIPQGCPRSSYGAVSPHSSPQLPKTPAWRGLRPGALGEIPITTVHNISSQQSPIFAEALRNIQGRRSDQPPQEDKDRYVSSQLPTPPVWHGLCPGTRESNQLDQHPQEYGSRAARFGPEPP